jgi:DNA (cytosine-5)-methyltransferase 1
MTGATLCSGIGAPETAMPDIEWKWCAEIEKFPSAVLSHHRPNVPNLGDITASDFIDRALALGPIDWLVAGTPCQGFSVAGLRGSMNDDRSNLCLRFVRICDAINPRRIIWENVPGVLSTADNAFGCFLGALAGADSALVPAKGQRWSDAGLVDGPVRRLAWRLLDAQYYGLAQRRERVFVVGCPRDGQDPAEILLESTSVRRYPPKGREERERVAPCLEGRSGRSGANNFATSGGLIERERETVGSLCARDSKTVGNQFVNEGKVIPCQR